MRNFGVTIPKRDKKKMRTGSSKTRPRPRSTIRIRSKYSSMLIKGTTGPWKLIKNPGRGDDDPNINAQSNQEVQVASRMRIDQLGLEMSLRQRIGHWLHDPVDKMRRNNPSDDSTDHDGCERIDDTFAELTQMLEKGHGASGLVCWRGDLRIGIGFGDRFRPGDGCHRKFLGNW